MKKRRSAKNLEHGEDQPNATAKYVVMLVRSAEKELLGLPDDRFDTITKHLEMLKQNPRPSGASKLTGRTEYKLRVGDLRIIYEIHDGVRELVVIIIDDRKQVYRRLKQRR